MLGKSHLLWSEGIWLIIFYRYITTTPPSGLGSIKMSKKWWTCCTIIAFLCLKCARNAAREIWRRIFSSFSKVKFFYRDRERVNEEDLFSYFITKLDISKFRNCLHMIRIYAHESIHITHIFYDTFNSIIDSINYYLLS